VGYEKGCALGQSVGGPEGSDDGVLLGLLDGGDDG
jgi:hypothetical protein